MSIPITINFHKSIRPFMFDIDKHTMEADSYLDIISSCMNLFPKFEILIKKLYLRVNQHEELILVVNGKILDMDYMLLKPKATDTIIICPMIYGSGKFGTIIIGIALIAMSLFLPGTGIIAVQGLLGSIGTASVTGAAALASTAGSFSLIGSALLSIGTNLILGSLTGAISAPASGGGRSDAGSRTNNQVFNAFSNKVSTQELVPLNYGENRVGGHLISGKIKSVQHAKDEVILASDFT